MEMNSGFEKANLEIASDVSSGDWIRDSLALWVPFTEAQFTIGSVIPRGFESYVLIRHLGEGDHQGSLGPGTLETLLKILSQVTKAQEECLYAMWEGYGWERPGVPLTSARRPRFQRFVQPFMLRFGRHPHRRGGRIHAQPEEHPDLHTLPVGIMKSERFKLPHRNYLLARGPLCEATKIGHLQSGWFRPQSPNLLWPVNKSWILVTEIDFDATLIGGSENLVREILNTDSFTAKRFNITDTVEHLPISGD